MLSSYFSSIAGTTYPNLSATRGRKMRRQMSVSCTHWLWLCFVVEFISGLPLQLRPADRKRRCCKRRYCQYASQAAFPPHSGSCQSFVSCWWCSGAASSWHSSLWIRVFLSFLFRIPRIHTFEIQIVLYATIHTICNLSCTVQFCL